MINCIKHRLKNLLSISDKAERLDYLCVELIIYGYFLGAMFLDIETGISLFVITPQLTLIACVVIIVINTIQRINSLKMKRVSFLMLFIPIVGQIFSLYLLFAPSKK